MSFKDMVKRDSVSVFLNTEEFAELHTVQFDNMVFENIPVVLEKVRMSEKSLPQSNHTEGIFAVSAKAYFNEIDTEGNFPDQGKYFEINDGEALGKPFFRKYRVVTAENAMGMICLELEGIDE